MENSNILTLKKSIRNLGFGRKLTMPLVDAAIKVMQLLLNGHPKAMTIQKPTISRYAASLIGYYRGRISKPKSKITTHANLDNFINSFVKTIFFANGKIQNIKLFNQLFGTEIMDNRVSIKNVKKKPFTKCSTKVLCSKKNQYLFFKQKKTFKT